MIVVLAMEEFASRRRSVQRRIEEALRPAVADALDGTKNTGGYYALLNEVAAQWRIQYRDESGEATATRRMGVTFRDQLHRQLRRTDRKTADANTIDRITTWLATAILSSTTIAAAEDDPEELFLEWVDMNDSKVRHTHRDASGQVRPIGEKFKVGDHKMTGPGDPSVPIELWINCRCTLRPTLASEALAAATKPSPFGEAFKIVPSFGERQGGGYPVNNCSDLKKAIQAIGRAKPEDRARTIRHIKSEKKRLGCPEVELPDTWAVIDKDNLRGWPDEFAPLEEPTHAGLAVYAADSGRIILMQRSWDEEDAPEVRGTWEFPGGHIEEGETPEEGARREFAEETGCPVPEGEITNGWRSEDGVYQGFVLTVPVEAEAFETLNPAESDTVNPDDPERETPEVTAWFTIQQIKDLGTALRPEVHKTPWAVFGGDEMTTTENEVEPDLETPEGEEPKFTADNATPWHGVLAPEGVWSGDKRKFKEGSLSHRPLPLPLTWQKTSADGHGGNVTVARIDRVAMVEGEMRAAGVFLATPEADETVGLLAEFGRFGVSVDADSVSFEMNDEEEGVEFAAARVSSACIVAIPAFAEAFVSLGEAPEGFLPEDAEEDPCENRDEDGNCLDEKDPEERTQVGEAANYKRVDAAGNTIGEAVVRTPEEEALVASTMAKTEDGPGWLTHPVDTDRLRDYWVRGAGAAKIGWGSPGDFNRCRALVAEYVKPQHINGYCANRHYDALGTWPGRGAHASESVEFTEAAEALTLTAAGGHCAPSEWFQDPEFDSLTPMTITEEGRVFGHIAGWTTCHSAWADKCVTPPRSQTAYAYFLLGEVLTEDGPVATGCLTIGGGHADGRLGLRAAIEHYDNSTAVFADVTVGEDDHGIWFAGWVRPGTSPEMIHAARASKLSGDWRRNAHSNSMEMVAALAVNTPGFAIPRIAASVEHGEQISLVAAGAVVPEEGTPTVAPEFNPEDFAAAVVREIDALQKRRATLASIQERLNERAAAGLAQRQAVMAGLKKAEN